MTESDLTGLVIATVQAHGYPAWRNAQLRRGKKHGGLGTGSSDVIACIEGRFVAIEVKLPKGGVPVTKEQLDFLEKVERAGGFGAVVRSVCETSECVRAVREHALGHAAVKPVATVSHARTKNVRGAHR